MATLNQDSFFNYVEGRGQNAYGAAVLVKDPESGVDKYSMLVASSTIPSIQGSSESFEFDLLNMPTKGKIEGKPSVEAKEVEILHHRDNAYRFYKLKGRTLNFLVISKEFMAYSFVGTVSYRPNDGGSDVWMGTYTITPMSAEPTPIFDARDLIAPTLNFKEAIPDTVKVGDELDLANVHNYTTVNFNVLQITSGTNEILDISGAAISNTYFTSEGTKITFKKPGLYAITVSDSATGNNKQYASWTTTIYVEQATTTT